MADEDILRKLRDKAAFHRSEAERYANAAELVAAEMGVSARSTGGKRRTRRSSNENNTPNLLKRLLDQNPRPWHLNELVVLLEENGWETTAVDKLNTIRTAALRSTQRGEIVRLPDGSYITSTLFPAPGNPPADSDHDNHDDDEPGVIRMAGVG